MAPGVGRPMWVRSVRTLMSTQRGQALSPQDTSTDGPIKSDCGAPLPGFARFGVAPRCADGLWVSMFARRPRLRAGRTREDWPLRAARHISCEAARSSPPYALHQSCLWLRVSMFDCPCLRIVNHCRACLASSEADERTCPEPTLISLPTQGETTVTIHWMHRAVLLLSIAPLQDVAATCQAWHANGQVVMARERIGPSAFWAHAALDPDGWPAITYSHTFFALPPLMQEFTRVHECMHLALPTSNEVHANCEALKLMRARGLSAQQEHYIGAFHGSLGQIPPQYGGTGQTFWALTMQCSGVR